MKSFVPKNEVHLTCLELVVCIAEHFYLSVRYKRQVAGFKGSSHMLRDSRPVGDGIPVSLQCVLVRLKDEFARVEQHAIDIEYRRFHVPL